MAGFAIVFGCLLVAAGVQTHFGPLSGIGVYLVAVVLAAEKKNRKED